MAILIVRCMQHTVQHAHFNDTVALALVESLAVNPVMRCKGRL
jgi:hypothetical protein